MLLANGRRDFFARLVGGLAFAFGMTPQASADPRGFVVDVDPAPMPTEEGISFRLRPLEAFHEAARLGMAEDGDTLEYRLRYRVYNGRVFLTEYRYGHAEPSAGGRLKSA